MFQLSDLQFNRALSMAAIALATLLTNIGNLRGNDTSKLSQQSREVLRAIDAGLWGQESLDNEGNVLRVCIDRPNSERLQKLVRAFPTLTFINFRTLVGSLAPEDLRSLDDLPSLTGIWFLSPLTDQWAEAFSRFPKLQELHLIVRLGITERGFSALASLKNVETLTLSIGYNTFHPSEDEHGAAILRQFPNVKTLALSGGSVSSRTLLEVGQHQQLLVLRCGSSQAKLKEADYAPLAQLRHLEEAELPSAAAPNISTLVSLKRVRGFSDIDNEGLRHLAGLQNLEEVILSSKHLTDQSLIHLKGATALTTLQLRCPKLDGSGLVYLGGCKQLRRLVLRQANFQPQSVGQLTALTALEYLDLGWTPMGEGENWQSLATLKVLSDLKEVQVELGEPDRVRLSEMLPGVSIYFLE